MIFPPYIENLLSIQGEKVVGLVGGKVTASVLVVGVDGRGVVGLVGDTLV